ncbi:hypothetical protein DPMN_167015 [Dreissena polymorpha]|uniref:Uncharacterized protein n=1 Tax=Dreissena polymorpha TaxID=45954 RepID=A0A9D4IYE3_DREPO|nr:hypothetical protein DPMN_167015 [Dreissena polymorpha]
MSVWLRCSWPGSGREGRLSAARDKRPIEPCRHAASRVYARTETATYVVWRRTDRPLVGQYDASEPGFVVPESPVAVLLGH